MTGVLAPALSAAQLPGIPGSSEVRATLVSDVAAVAPGSTFQLGVRLEIKEGWHVNWLNPGDAGLAPSVAWRLPEGFTAGVLEWPAPARFVTGPISIFGYAGAVVLTTEVRAPTTLKPGTQLEFGADVSWLACAEACVPGNDEVALSVPVEARPRVHKDGAALIEASRRAAPRVAAEWAVSARMDDSETLKLEFQSAGTSATPLEDVYLFPLEQGLIDNAAPQVLALAPGPGGNTAYTLRVQRDRMGGAPPTRLRGVLVSRTGWGPGASPGALTLDIPLAQ